MDTRRVVQLDNEVRSALEAIRLEAEQTILARLHVYKRVKLSDVLRAGLEICHALPEQDGEVPCIVRDTVKRTLHEKTKHHPSSDPDAEDSASSAS